MARQERSELAPRCVQRAHRAEELRRGQPPGVLVDHQHDRLERVGSDSPAAARCVAFEAEIEAEEPHVDHRLHRAPPVERRSLFGDLMSHVSEKRRRVLDRARDVADVPPERDGFYPRM